MTTPRNDDFYASARRSRNSPHEEELHGAAGFFQAGQVPVTYPNQWVQQPRSSPQGRSDYSTSAHYAAWAEHGAAVNPTHALYEHHDPRFAPSTQYPSYAQRPASPAYAEPHDPRRLPPLNVYPSTGRDDRTYQDPYAHHAMQVSPTTNIRSPVASYPSPFTTGPSHQPTYSSSYSYPPVPEPHGGPQHGMPQHAPPFGQRPQPVAAQSTAPIRSKLDVHASFPYPKPMGGSTSPEDRHFLGVGEERTVKKKRKRADAQQLKVLNEVYNRTAFPTTEERMDLANRLDMSARSVQIWFQNKRQSMRQTTSRSSGPATQNYSAQPFSLESQGAHSSHAVPRTSYPQTSGVVSRPSPGSSGSALSQTSRSPPPGVHRESPSYKYGHRG